MALATNGTKTHSTLSTRSHVRYELPIAKAFPSFKGVQSLVAGWNSTTEQVVPCKTEPAFTLWLKRRGFGARQQKVTVHDFGNQGRGLMATTNVQKGALLLAIPKDLVIFPQTAATESCLCPLLQNVHQLPDWSLLALFLAEQRYLLQQTDDNGRWTPYIKLLPQSPVGTVLDWTDNEVGTLLSGSGLLSKAQTIRSAAELLWQDLQPLISAGKQQGLAPADMFSRSDVMWAVGVCLSRTVRLDDMAGEPVVLVPYADLLNHDVASEAYLVWDEQQQAVVLQPDRKYKAGQQVFISYGPKSSGELLLSYGFCPPPGSNPHDAAHIMLSLHHKDTFRTAKEQALTARNIPHTETFAVRIDALPAGLLPYLAFCTAELQLESEVEQLAVQLFDEGNLPSINGVSCEQLALSALARQCKELLQGYSQSMEDDREQAARVSVGGGYEQRHALMAAIRLKERQILVRTEFVAQQRVRQLRKTGKTR